MTKAAKKDFVLTKDVVERVITVVDAGLSTGLGSPKPGKMCVEAAVCYALGLPHGDDPKCVDPILRLVKIGLNDCDWSSREERADGLRRLAVLQLGTRDVLDNKTFMKKVVLMIITTVLPIVLKDIGLSKRAECCAAAKTFEEGIAAAYAAGYMTGTASYAARHAASAARHAASDTASAASAARHAACAARYAASDTASAARHAACAARYAARAASYAASDKILKTYAEGIEDILIEMGVPAVKYLDLL